MQTLCRFLRLRGIDVLDRAQHIVRAGQADAGAVLDLVVDLLKVLGRAAADLEHIVELAGERVAGDDVRVFFNDADKIIVLDNGAVVGQGKHETLLNECEAYARIAASQEMGGVE